MSLRVIVGAGKVGATAAEPLAATQPKLRLRAHMWRDALAAHRAGRLRATEAARFTKVAGAPAPKPASVPYPVLWTGGLFSPMLRELRITRYQFVRPFTIDATLTERTFGLAPIELDTALAPVARAG